MADSAEERRRRKGKAMAGPSFDPYDHISQLPDCILTSSIISYLPIKECARTTYSPLDGDTYGTSPLSISTQAPSDAKAKTLDATSLRRKALTLEEADDIAWRVAANEAIISRHRGPIRSLRLSEPICSRLRVNTGDRWIKVPDRKGIQNLIFYGNLPSLFSRCHSLRTLELLNGYFLYLDTFSMIPLSPNLRELRLRPTLIRNTSLSHILSSCQLLNTLELNGCMYFVDEITHISSPCLWELTIYGAFHGNAALSIEEAPNFEISMWIEDTPNLEILMLDEIFTEQMPLKVVNAPKLRQLGVVNANDLMLQFGYTHFQRKMSINLDTRMHSLTTLTTRVNFSDACQAKILAGLLTCFPCLEILNILVKSCKTIFLFS